MPADLQTAPNGRRANGRTTSGEHVWMKITKHRTPELAKGDGVTC